MDGTLATLDLSTGAATTVGRFGSGDGDRNLSNGALSVHPETGEVWALENNFAARRGVPAVFRVDPATGLTIGPVVPVGLDGAPANFGFGAMQILPDGRFVVVSGGFIGDVFWLDPTTRPLAELTPITLAVDPGIDGTVNGLEFIGAANQPPIADAGMVQMAECASPEGSTVTLDGTGSYDPDGDPITYLWEAEGVTLDDPTSSAPTGTFPLGTTVANVTVTDACDASVSGESRGLTLNDYPVHAGDLVRLRLEHRTRLKRPEPPFDPRLRAPWFVMATGPVTDASGNSATGHAAITIELFADAELDVDEIVPGSGEPGHSMPADHEAAEEFAEHLEELGKKGYSNPPGIPSAAVNPLSFDVPDLDDEDDGEDDD